MSFYKVGGWISISIRSMYSSIISGSTAALQRGRFDMRLLLLLFCGMFVFCSCGPRVTDATRGVAEKTLKVGIGPEPQDLDPHAVTGVTEAKVQSALFEGLVVEDPSDLSPKPGMAERWEVAASGLEYVFHLRPNARWSNGQPLTAKDFVYSFQRILSRELGSQNAYML